MRKKMYFLNLAYVSLTWSSPVPPIYPAGRISNGFFFSCPVTIQVSADFSSPSWSPKLVNYIKSYFPIIQWELEIISSRSNNFLYMVASWCTPRGRHSCCLFRFLVVRDHLSSLCPWQEGLGCQAPVTHAYNPSYSGSRDQENWNLQLEASPGQIVPETLSPKYSTQKQS
jgi:hypothetical protein